MSFFVCLGALLALTFPGTVRAQQENQVSASDLIALVNNDRAGNGLTALNVNSILMSTAQQTAETMAANNMTWHIGDVRGRVMAAGYGGGSIAYATENFAIGPMTIDEIAYIWSDADHMIPMVNGSYRDIGAGVATASDGSVYYIVQAAYTGSGAAPTATTAHTLAPGETPADVPTEEAISQFIAPVVLATPGTDGRIIHQVQYGQSLWAIAIAYGVKIVDILNVNGLSPEDQTVYPDEKLVIPLPSGTARATVLGSATLPASQSTPQGTAQLTPTTDDSQVTPTKAPTLTPRPVLSEVDSLTPTLEDTPEFTPTAEANNHLSTAGLFQAGSSRLVWGILIGVFLLGVALIVLGNIARRKNL